MLGSNAEILVASVVVYLLVSIGIGVYAARRVKSSRDYVVAGRSLPLYITLATVFATWFGSETVLGTSSTFISEGLAGIVADPFGAALCLVLVGLFFAVPLYRMNLITIGDFYRLRYGRSVEVLTSIAIMISYLGWVAAQLTALGLVFNIITHGAISEVQGMFIGAAVVVIYTLYGGMWSVAMTDFFQMTLIVGGLLYIAWLVTGQVDGGVATVVAHAADHGKLTILPEANVAGVLGFVGALVTMGLGSIPQQDVFQRVMSARDEKTARNGAVLGGLAYLLFAFVPIYLAYTAFIVAPDLVGRQLGEGGNSQLVLPTLILQHTPVLAQVLFFGALLSAIMSTASGTLLAPSTIFAENLLKPVVKPQSDQAFLALVRRTVMCFGVFVVVFAYHQMTRQATIFEMVENAYKVTLVAAFVPLAAGLYWRRASLRGALWSMGLGTVGWIALELLEQEWHGQVGWAWLGLGSMAGACPPQLFGLMLAILGMWAGSVWGVQQPRQPAAASRPQGHA